MLGIPTMRRVSVPLAFAALLVTAIVAYTYRSQIRKENEQKPIPAPQIQNGLEAVAHSGWKYEKDDPQTNKPIVRVSASSFAAAHDPSSFELKDLTLRLYHKDGGKYTYVKSGEASFDERSGELKSAGPVTIVMNVPADKNAENPAEVAKLVQVETSGVTYETKDGKADTDQPATFQFSQGGGKAVGAAYDPTTGELKLKNAVVLDLLSRTAGAPAMHVEAGNLLYKEKEEKIFLSPWSKLQRGGTGIQAASSVVTLDDGVLKQVDCEHANGSDVREDKQTQYSADHMTALFDDLGTMTKMLADGNAHVVSASATSRTTLTSARAELGFMVHPATTDGGSPESDLDNVTAEGNATAHSDPLPAPGQKTADADSHTLRSDRIILHMKPGGKDVQEIEAPTAAQLDFKPNRPDHPTRSLTASHLRIFYGEGSYIERFLAWDATTHTQKPPSENGKPVPPSTTWSDVLAATFKPNSNELANLEQTGHFRYQEGVRKASANKALLDQAANRITLIDSARMSDDTGSTSASKIVMNQANGDMDASGHVSSARAPDKSQKPGTSVLDGTKVLEARADNMQTREDNTLVVYAGHAAVWQGANRITADRVEINRDDQTLSARTHVVSELVDSTTSQGTNAVPTFTTIYAPELLYRDDVRRADYTGGVKLLRGGMTVTSKQLAAFLNPQNQSGDSSLNHAVAEGDVKVVETPKPGDTRVGTGQNCEYYTKENKVVLTGGAPQIADTLRGLTKGERITYFSDDDKLIVEGADKNLAYSQMRKKTAP
jgi:lipopolysaccharide export system protein LptA